MKASTLPAARGAVGRADRTALVAGAVLAIVFGATACGGGSPTTFDQFHAKSDVIDTCQDSVKKMLKDPDSARFDGWTASPAAGSPPAGLVYNPSAGDEYYTASGMVNAKNGFGGYNGDEPYSCDAVVTTGTVRAQARSGNQAAVTPPESTSPPAATPPYEGAPSSAPVHSQVMNVTLPAGTTTVGKDAGTIPGIEIWHVPLDPAAAVDYIRPQLPTGPYEGLPACPVDVTQNKFDPAPITSWLWENAAGDDVQIGVKTFWLKDDTPGPGSEVTITRDRESTPEPC